MTSKGEPSLEELREQSERSREALAATVDELRKSVGATAEELKTMVSPAHIKTEITNFVREERESLLDAVRRKAKDNPLQAAAIGAAVAYPALGLLRAIPAPMMLIGAGLFLTSQKGQKTVSDAKAKLEDAVREGSEKVTSAAHAVTSNLEETLASAGRDWDAARTAVMEGVGAVTAKARDGVQRAGETVRDSAQQAADVLKEKAEGVSAKVADTAGHATAIGQGSRSKADGFIQDNPLLVAGIFAAIGAFIASSIPPSETENRILGAGSDALKGKAREVAAQGVSHASQIVNEAVGAAASAAANEGFDAAGIKSSVSRLADDVRAVADRGLDTAFGTTSSHSTTGYPRNPT